MNSGGDGVFASYRVLAACAFVCLSAATIAGAGRWGYLSSRHLLLTLPLGIPWTAAAALELAERAAASFARWRSLSTKSKPRLAFAVVALLLASLAPWSLAPRHASHEAHRAAAAWLAGQSEVAARVLDTRGWTGLYSGRDTYRFTAARAALIDPDLRYIVAEEADLRRGTPRARSLAWVLDRAGQPAARFGAGRDAVVVYRWQPAEFLQAVDRVAWGN